MLLDVRVPGRSAIDLVPEMLEMVPGLAVLMLTGVNDATTAALCMQRGAMNYITKPIDLDQFMKVVRSVEDFWLTIVKLPNGHV